MSLSKFKLEDFVGGPSQLDVNVLGNRLPTLNDVLKHYLYLVNEAQTLKKGTWSSNELYNTIADDIIAIYKERSLITITKGNIVR